MKDLIEIKVECYSGYKSDETPRCFYLNDMRFEIKEITDRWYQADPKPGFPVSDYFKVSTPDDKQFIIKHERKNDKWYLWLQGETINLIH